MLRQYSTVIQPRVYFCVINKFVCIIEDVRAVAWQQRNKALMTSDKRMMETPVVEHGKQRWRTVNGTRTVERTFYQRF